MTVNIEEPLMAEFVIKQAREYGEYEDVDDTANEGRFGEHSYDTDWELADLNPNDCTVDMDGTSVVVHGELEGKYSVKVSGKTRHHPAEYERRSIPLLVSIRMDLSELPYPEIYVQRG